MKKVPSIKQELRDREDWARMVGGIVEVRLDGNLVRVGKVDHATADSTVLWIEADAVEPRALFVKSSGYKIRPCCSDAPR
jgi:ribosome maturation factor RimP